MNITTATPLAEFLLGQNNTWTGTQTGMTLTSPTINGTIATTGLTLPAVTLGGNMTVTGYAFDAGALSAEIDTTGNVKGLILKGSSSTNGPALIYSDVYTTPALNRAIGYLHWQGYDHAGTPALKTYGYFFLDHSNITDGTEEATFKWYAMAAGAENNVAMTLTGPGVLSVDLAGSGAAAQVDLFDEYDDALVLRQGIQQNNRELLADMGVFTRKDTGSGYMMNIQPMVRLLAGGIYQTRELIENTKEELINMIEHLESKLMLPEAR